MFPEGPELRRFCTKLEREVNDSVVRTVSAVPPNPYLSVTVAPVMPTLNHSGRRRLESTSRKQYGSEMQLNVTGFIAFDNAAFPTASTVTV
jgi:hypothetical protein